VAKRQNGQSLSTARRLKPFFGQLNDTSAVLALRFLQVLQVLAQLFNLAVVALHHFFNEVHGARYLCGLHGFPLVNLMLRSGGRVVTLLAGNWRTL
jgi:hypothetical protein